VTTKPPPPTPPDGTIFTLGHTINRAHNAYFTIHNGKLWSISSTTGELSAECSPDTLGRLLNDGGASLGYCAIYPDGSTNYQGDLDKLVEINTPLGRLPLAYRGSVRALYKRIEPVYPLLRPMLSERPRNFFIFLPSSLEYAWAIRAAGERSYIHNNLDTGCMVFDTYDAALRDCSRFSAGSYVTTDPPTTCKTTYPPGYSPERYNPYNPPSSSRPSPAPVVSADFTRTSIESTAPMNLKVCYVTHTTPATETKPINTVVVIEPHLRTDQHSGAVSGNDLRNALLAEATAKRKGRSDGLVVYIGSIACTPQ
jgi:hypothetical protein